MAAEEAGEHTIDVTVRLRVRPEQLRSDLGEREVPADPVGLRRWLGQGVESGVLLWTENVAGYGVRLLGVADDSGVAATS